MELSYAMGFYALLIAGIIGCFMALPALYVLCMAAVLYVVANIVADLYWRVM